MWTATVLTGPSTYLSCCTSLPLALTTHDPLYTTTVSINPNENFVSLDKGMNVMSYFSGYDFLLVTFGLLFLELGVPYLLVKEKWGLEDDDMYVPVLNFQ